MSEEKKVNSTDAKKAAKSKSDKPNIFVRAGKRIAEFFKGLKSDIKKINWPTFKMVLKSSGIVLLVVAILGVAIALVDWGISLATDGVVSLTDKLQGDTTQISEIAETIQ